MLNQITIIGNLGKDAELQASGKMLRARVATTERYKNKQGEYVDDTQWHTVKYWSDYAPQMIERFRKGVRVVVVGSITYEEYNGKTEATIKAKSIKALSSAINRDNSQWSNTGNEWGT